jgi:ferredoxin-type protein NapH
VPQEDITVKIRIHKLQILRHAVQILVILLLLLVPAVARYANSVAADDIDGQLKSWEGSLQGRTMAGIDTVFRSLPEGEMTRPGLDTPERDRQGVIDYSRAFRGGPWSAELFGLSMTDPLAALESMIASKHIAKVIGISLIAPIILTLLFGRVFCSWICPMGLLLEITDTFRKFTKFLEIKSYNIRFERGTKFAVLAVGLTASALLSVPVLGYIYPPAIISRELHDLVFTLFDRAEANMLGFSLVGLTWMSFILLAIIAFEVLVSRRWWCRYMCPGGAIYMMIGAKRPVRVKLFKSKCTRCVDCVVACPMGLNPMNNQMGMECDNCGACISACDDDALRYTVAIRSSSAETADHEPAMVAK